MENVSEYLLIFLEWPYFRYVFVENFQRVTQSNQRSFASVEKLLYKRKK